MKYKVTIEISDPQDTGSRTFIQGVFDPQENDWSQFISQNSQSLTIEIDEALLVQNSAGLFKGLSR